ncbi:ATP-dependent DNA helicase RecG [Symmachiella dynata]|uniref:ATP-dependent DNA helicase RecG n=1 Tax=Symmachiella dynata TaxID=2527995 RepID=UPI0030EC3B43
MPVSYAEDIPQTRRPSRPHRTMSDDPLQTPVQFLKGVGPARAELLEKLDVRTAEDVLFDLPRDYLDLTVVKPVAELEEGQVQTVRGRVVDLDGKKISGNRTLSAVLLDCDGDFVRGVWFNQHWVLKRFQPNDLVLFSAKVKRASGRWEMSHPMIQWLDEEDAEAGGGVLPIYRLTEGLNMQAMRRITRQTLESHAEFVPEELPEKFRQYTDLMPITAALHGVHFPQTIEQRDAARRRLVFQDLLEFQLGLALRRRLRTQQPISAKMPTTSKIDARIRRLFPFEFTAGQNSAVADIVQDLDSGHAMHRLLQADVGAGKTAVAIYATLVAIAAGYQAVLMAPTELLATQHWGTVEAILAHSRVNRLLLTGSLNTGERRQALADISSGAVQLIVGTQAVIQKDVNFANLGLVVIDEQHKFGVMQRAHFSSGDRVPHVLVMTATPIPRSLCLTQFGDLDLSVVSDMPPGRCKVTSSRVYTAAARKKAWEFIRRKLQSGRQAYIVCPRVQANESDAETEDASAEAVFRELSDGELSGFRMGLVHGQMDRERKAAAMESFRSGEIQAIVSTTVVEVGVDVPNATLMVIYQAERFGLSQLHQLRGRIARGRFDGYCFLFSETDNPEAVSRLQAMERTSNGFEIAETDFELRGPGDVLGTRQHGDLPLRVADLTTDGAVLREARKVAFQLVDSGRFDDPDYAPLKIRVLDRFREQMDLVGSG